MELQGFAMVSDSADFKNVMGTKEDWIGKPIMALELNDRTKSALLLNGTNMGMFDYDDLIAHFQCQMVGDVLVPVGLNEIDKMLYHGLVIGRNGGYNTMVRQMVIMSSLHRREFSDNILWQKGQDETTIEMIKSLKSNAKKQTAEV
jgi:hypothetical protein